jgi:hypothetical protein
VDYSEYVARLKQNAAGVDLSQYAEVMEGGRPYPLFRITIEPRGTDRWLVVTSGFHGEEPAGPLTLATHLPDIVQSIQKRGIGARIYPCINPSGFEDGTRYNRSGEKPNNDLLRYEVAPGEWLGELQSDAPFLSWKPYDGGPKETRALVTELMKHPAPAAALDIHQDNYLAELMTYAYTFGDRKAFVPLMEAASAHATVARRIQVDEAHKTDENGLIEYHDGSVTDLYMRRGVPFCAALETTTRTPRDRCHAINLIWVRGFIGLAADGVATP